MYHTDVLINKQFSNVALYHYFNMHVCEIFLKYYYIHVHHQILKVNVIYFVSSVYTEHLWCGAYSVEPGRNLHKDN